MPTETDLIVLDGSTFFYTEENGDSEADHHEGFFYRDVRHLSRWLLFVDGAPIEPLTSRRVDYYSARILGTPAKRGDDKKTVSIRRDRFISEGMHEDVVVENLKNEPHELTLRLAFGADFADLMEAQSGEEASGRTWQETTSRSVTLWREREGYRRGTVVTFNRTGRLTKQHATFRLRLAPREVWSLCVDVTPVVDGKRKPPLLRCGAFHKHAAKMPISLDEWLGDAPDLVTDDLGLERTYKQSILDLAALRVRPDDVKIKWALPGGGIPWFMTIFGRDSLIAAYQTIPFHSELAQATLEALAQLQAKEWDNFRDAEPGKIPHELRRGTLAALGKIPHTPYYGSHDATILWLIVLDEYERWSGDTSFVKRMEEPARAALAWLEGPADLDGDGYIEYRKRSDSDKALDNHCWKDSDNSILFADGHAAEPPIATCELQGYAYDARLRTARLLREIWDDAATADRLERDAAELKRRFNRDFWIKGRRHYALALDGEKRQVDSLTSNIGHLLWSGIVDAPRAAGIVRALLRDDMFSGWGIRSMSSNEAGFNPLEYHNGTVWPHDTAICAEGMRRYGFHDEAGRVCKSVLDAADAFSNQLPEVFAGFPRDATGVPIEYPDALKPQSWSAATPLLVLRTLLGLDVVDGRLRSRLMQPTVGRLALRRVEVRGQRVDVPSPRNARRRRRAAA
jgi:glycogen debranching enzyme